MTGLNFWWKKAIKLRKENKKLRDIIKKVNIDNISFTTDESNMIDEIKGVQSWGN